METQTIYPIIEEYVRYVYECDGHILPEEDEFFDELLMRHHGGSETARSVNRRINELGIGTTEGNRLSLLPPGIMMMEAYGGSIDRFIRANQEKTSAETQLPPKQLKDILFAKVVAIVGVILSLISLFRSC